MIIGKLTKLLDLLDMLTVVLILIFCLFLADIITGELRRWDVGACR
jgi:hypothetical protein